jgi:DNA-binding transcriptional MerR regulator
MTLPSWKVGELARRTGLTVRTLHYYDAIGLLRPGHRTAAGHRLYTGDDVARLQQVQSLRQLGFSLDEIRHCLERKALTRQGILELHLERLRTQIELQQRLYQRLATIAGRLDAAEEVSVDELTEAMEAMKMFEKYMTPEQLKELEERGRQLGPDHIREVEAEWPRLIAAVRAEMEKGTDPTEPAVLALARRWRELVLEFTGGNPGIEKSVRTLYQQEPSVSQRTGLDPQIFAYVNQAIAALKATS